MAKVTTTEHPKISLIIQCALAILSERGEHGLTMRQVAVSAGMSLSNVQYYFTNKNELLKGMVEYYAAECDASFESYLIAANADTPQKRVRSIIEYGLCDGECLSAMCRILRELQAISSRNEDIKLFLRMFYRRFIKMISEFLAPLAVSEAAVSKAVSLLVPYLEGYSMTACSLPYDKEQCVGMLYDLVLNILQSSEQDGRTS
ncbi:TetR/AcrR family transcriptional regulator [Halodesulfovibrio spirochaetisodalis]|uniref:TetR/AcrR family transcriptional regulator n=1 Tax=Halodesulfovibrio spirochaetisodalis TaxID=1560234 RepID=UPI00082C6C9B|nr:TetR/AcrR family transcriptional regulator [Halodesulfovibrio spirochaetisodalis]